MQFNAPPGGNSNPLLPPTPPPTSNGEEICRDFLKVYTLFLKKQVLTAKFEITEKGGGIRIFLLCARRSVRPS